MNLATVAEGLGWMTSEESALTGVLAKSMADDFARHGVADSPLLAMRAEDVIVSYLHVRRVEAPLKQPESDQSGNPPDAKTIVALIETAGKARERLRKAMKELEDACAKAGTPIDGGIADQMKPLLKQAEGVLEDALRFEKEKSAKG